MEPFRYAPPQDSPRVIHEDAEILLADKPAGLLSVPGKAAEHADCMLSRLQARFPEILLVHRLDMATSGIMVFARTRAAQKSLGRQFEKRLVFKRYIAEVAGRVATDRGTIDLPLIADWPNRPRQMVDHARGRPARTEWAVLERRRRSTLLALFPRTGRSHQLRVHMAAIGHPILGDPFYGDAARAPRLMLHADSLGLIVPGSGERVMFAAPCPFAGELPEPEWT